MSTNETYSISNQVITNVPVQYLFLKIFQILLSLPNIKHDDLVAFEEALAKTSSPKEQKQHMKSLLVLATGNQLKALAAQKSVNTITNVSGNYSETLLCAFISYGFEALLIFAFLLSVKSRGSVSTSETRLDEGDSLGLAAIL